MLPKFRQQIIQTFINKCLNHFASKLMQMPKFRHIQTQITQQVPKFRQDIFLCTFYTPSVAWLPKFRQVMLLKI